MNLAQETIQSLYDKKRRVEARFFPLMTEYVKRSHPCAEHVHVLDVLDGTIILAFHHNGTPSVAYMPLAYIFDESWREDQRKLS
ncbi:hypothetical protein IMZ31_19775 (plasmid) [Pontibacillus sp. ALD_SL1]|uniref:hypothetical protein n=1 Tax=Pontibacillus sp. ALD_SL1 TaxID=2777185 RepID=UPI001A95B585|nr:hypothetical protein [Pontibacillus sp. ALD_SL1]QST02791.1 hypothetical protein IMZ31_19775 [Pontibacillus sp. ALD_SL1]